MMPGDKKDSMKGGKGGRYLGRYGFSCLVQGQLVTMSIIDTVSPEFIFTENKSVVSV